MGQMGEKNHLQQANGRKGVGEFLPNGGNIPKSNMLVLYFLPYGKNNHIGFFLPWDFS
jgi:hypothetical protein